MTLDLSAVEALGAFLGPVGALLGAWALLRKSTSEGRAVETDSTARAAKVSADTAISIMAQQRELVQRLLDRTSGLEKGRAEDREDCERRLTAERERCDAHLASLRADFEARLGRINALP